MLNNLADFYTVLQTQDYIMSPDAADRARMHVETTVAYYRKLSVRAAASVPPQCRWKELPKFHYALHVGLQALAGNPRFTWTYADEDFMGSAKTICERCTEGTAPHAVVVKMLQKWGYGVALRLRD